MYELTMPQEYLDITHFGGATIGVKLELTNHPKGLDFFSAGEGMHHAIGSPFWYFDGPFIVGQHVDLWWFRSKPPCA